MASQALIPPAADTETDIGTTQISLFAVPGMHCAGCIG